MLPTRFVENCPWLFLTILILVRTMVNNLQSRFHQMWYILVFKVPAQCENCLKIMVHYNNHPTLMGTYYLWIGWMSPIWHMCHIMHQPRYVSSSVLQRLPTIWRWSSPNVIHIGFQSPSPMWELLENHGPL